MQDTSVSDAQLLALLEQVAEGLAPHHVHVEVLANLVSAALEVAPLHLSLQGADVGRVDHHLPIPVVVLALAPVPARVDHVRGVDRWGRGGTLRPLVFCRHLMFGKPLKLSKSMCSILKSGDAHYPRKREQEEKTDWLGPHGGGL